MAGVFDSTFGNRAWFGCSLMAAILLAGLEPVPGQVVSIDLDRTAPGVQSSIGWVVGDAEILLGAVVVQGASGTPVGAYALEVQVVNPGTTRTTLSCARSEWSQGDVLDSGGDHVVETCTGRSFRRTSLFVTPAVIGEEGFAALFHFDLAVRVEPGDVLDLTLTPFDENPLFGVEVGERTRSIGNDPSTGIDAIGAVLRAMAPTPTPTPTFTPSPTPTPTPANHGLLQVIEGMRAGTHGESDLLKESLLWKR